MTERIAMAESGLVDRKRAHAEAVAASEAEHGRLRDAVRSLEGKCAKLQEEGTNTRHAVSRAADRCVRHAQP